MTNETGERRPLPLAGWYPDPEAPGRMRYWTGTQWWTQEGRPTSPAKPPHPVGRGFARLAGGLGILMGLTMVVLVLELALYIWGYSMIEDAVGQGDFDSLDTFDGLNQALTVAELAMLLAAGICWMVWQHRLAKASLPGELRRDPGMHAFSWIIPVVAVWFPFQNVSDLWQSNVQSRGRAILGWWWAGWIVSNVLGRVTSAMDGQTDSVSEFRALMVAQVLEAFVALLAAALAIRILRALTAGGLARSAA